MSEAETPARSSRPLAAADPPAPAKPAYLRVKVWRRLQALGAVTVKNTVYALPASEQTREDLEWVLKEVVEGGGEGMICEARLVDGLSDQEVRALFNAAREADYEPPPRRTRRAREAGGKPMRRPGRGPGRLARLRRRLAQAIGHRLLRGGRPRGGRGPGRGLEALLRRRR